MEQLAANVWLQHGSAEGFPTAAALVLTRQRAVVIDTLTSPQAVAPLAARLKEEPSGRRLTVVTTHHHWDHVYGNACFPRAEIVAHVACLRLLREQAAGRGEPVPSPPPEGVPPPTLTFAGELTLRDDDGALRLVHVPGHSQDSLAVFLEPAGLLFAGDALEWPLPSLGPGSDLEEWLDSLRRLRALGARLLVPAHGPVMGAELLDANERYLAGLGAAVAAARRVRPPAHPPDLPADDFVTPGVVLTPLYREAHAANVAQLWQRSGPAG